MNGGHGGYQRNGGGGGGFGGNRTATNQNSVFIGNMDYTADQDSVKRMF